MHLIKFLFIFYKLMSFQIIRIVLPFGKCGADFLTAISNDMVPEHFIIIIATIVWRL